MSNLNRQIITCTGYGGTGSSAITDLLKEFDNGLSMGDAEFWILQDYHGVSDLEYFLIDGNHRSIVSFAINNFIKYALENEKFYTKYFGQSFKTLTEEYIESLVDAKFKKALSVHEVQNKLLKFIIFNLSTKIQYIFNKLLGKDAVEFSPFIPTVYKTYSVPNRNRFYANTKKYTDSLFNTIDPDKKYDFLAFDQLVPATNVARYLNYVDNMKVIVVDRDPRDLFLLNEVCWKKGAFICDTSSIDEFIVWYKTIRLHRSFEIQNQNIVYIMFEDLVYEYENSLEKIYEFLKLNPENHTLKKSFFNPDISKKNTKLWIDNSKYKIEIKKIEDKLSDYCHK